MPQLGEPFNPHGLFNGSFIPEPLMRWKCVSSPAKLVWSRLARYKGKSGNAFPGYPKLATECGISERYCIRLMQELIDVGLVKRIERKGKTNIYELLWHQIFVGNTRAELAARGEQSGSSEQVTGEESGSGAGAQSGTTEPTNRSPKDSPLRDSPKRESSTIPKQQDSKRSNGSGCKWCNFSELTPQKAPAIFKAMHDDYKELFNSCPSFLIKPNPFEAVKPLIDAGKKTDDIVAVWHGWLRKHDPFEDDHLNVSYFVNHYDDIARKHQPAPKPADVAPVKYEVAPIQQLINFLSNDRIAAYIRDNPGTSRPGAIEELTKQYNSRQEVKADAAA
jgi:hypothetical protein